jgi:hypothetical protein
MLAGADSWARSFGSFCEYPGYKKSIDGILERSGGALSREDAQLLEVFGNYGCVLAAAAREARGDYAGLTHAYYNLLEASSAREARGDYAGLTHAYYNLLAHCSLSEPVRSVAGPIRAGRWLPELLSHKTQRRAVGSGEYVRDLPSRPSLSLLVLQ